MSAATPTIHVLAFASAREILGFSEQTFTWKPHETAEQLLGRLTPQSQQLCAQARVAINETYTGWDTVLQPGQTVAILPPVSGG
jgi:molybdopterin synthase sulfur carrier subunit